MAWSPPPLGFVKVNTDGSSFSSPQHCGCGGVMCSEVGTWIIGFSASSWAQDITILELLAIREGLELAWCMGYHRLICESDCQEAIVLIDSPSLPWAFDLQELVKCIQLMIKRDLEVPCRLIMGSANSVADALAKLGASSLDGLHLWSKPLTGLQSMLNSDSIGCS